MNIDRVTLHPSPTIYISPNDPLSLISCIPTVSIIHLNIIFGTTNCDNRRRYIWVEGVVGVSPLVGCRTTYILKPRHSGTGSAAVVEHLCTAAARRLALDVASTAIATY